jgi:hypothetical protein
MVIPMLCFFLLPKEFTSFQEVAINGIGLSIGWLIGVIVTRHPIRLELKNILFKTKSLT